MRDLQLPRQLPGLELVEEELIADWEFADAILNPVFVASPIRNSPLLTPGESIAEIKSTVEDESDLETIAPSRPITPSPRR